MKTNSEYISDSSGKIIVNHIGKTENLNEDILQIAEHLGLRSNTEARPLRVNQSKHSSDFNQYFKYKLQKKLFNLIYKKDILLYEKVSNLSPSHDWKGEEY